MTASTPLILPDFYSALSESMANLTAQATRPAVTLSYAQSLDGCIAHQRGQPLALSCQESLVMTHQLRAAHHGILVGVGTVLADNPRLKVRLADGSHPQPIVMDSALRIPLDCVLMRESSPWIFTTSRADPQRIAQLQTLGARVLVSPANADGLVAVSPLLATLCRAGIHSLMVEGGAGILRSFLESRLADFVVLTIAPLLLGGLPALEQLPAPVNLRVRNWQAIGRDWVLWGQPQW